MAREDRNDDGSQIVELDQGPPSIILSRNKLILRQFEKKTTVSTIPNSKLKISRLLNGQDLTWHVDIDPNNPPQIFFDTNVWISMNDRDLTNLTRLKRKYGFRYRYSILNYVELVSHLDEVPTKKKPDPFKRYQKCFYKIRTICESEALPSAELALLKMAKLDKYIDPIWISPSHISSNIFQIIEARNMSDQLRSSVNPSHYRTIRDVDGESFQNLMKELNEIQPPISGSNEKQLDILYNWFIKFVTFFFLIRPAKEGFKLQTLSAQDTKNFFNLFTEGIGTLFFRHCTNIVKKTINDGKKIDPNDLYDMLQLMMLEDNTLFITSEKSFFQYDLDPQIQKVFLWRAFQKSF